MDNNIKQINGKTSTFIPGSNGDSGSRAIYTFYASVKEERDQQSQYFIYKRDPTDPSTNISVKNPFSGSDEYPGIFDYIIYVDNNNTYLYMITDKRLVNGQIETSGELIDKWETKTNNPIIDNNIDIEITCERKTISYYPFIATNFYPTIRTQYNPDEYNNDFKIDSGINTKNKILLEGDIDQNNTTHQDSSSCFSFKIENRDSTKTIGSYKIVIEFFTDLISPAMDGVIANKFKPVNLSQEITDRSGDNITFRGYLMNYASNTAVNKEAWTELFIEKLDNFEITIKDFNDGVGQTSYESDIILPRNVLRQAYEIDDTDDHKYKYNCYMYAYVHNYINPDIIEKIFISDLTKTITDFIK